MSPHVMATTVRTDRPAGTDTPAATAWHALPPADAAAALDSPEAGLTSAEVLARRDRFGPNRLTPPAPRPAWKRFLAQFDNILIHVLLAAGAIALALGEFTDAGVIAGVVLINAAIGYIQEGKAEQALDAIRGMLSPQAVALRDGRQATIPAEDLVPGDRVLVAAGDRVPADVRVVRAKGLRAQEAALTGESVPVAKDPGPVPPDAALGDRAGMLWSGTLVTQGQGTGIVVATGDATEIGRIGRMLASVDTMTTPLLARMAVFGRWLSMGILALAVFTFSVGVFVRGEPWSEMLLAAVGLAVAAIPEGLPAVMTITLAIGVTRMARRNAIIRRLPAVETLGSVGVICSDKTGTLTRNELTVGDVVTLDTACAVSGEGYRPDGAFTCGERPVEPAAVPALMETARAALLCNDAALVRDETGAWTVSGDPTDGALLALAGKAGLNAEEERRRHPRLDVIPFESDHKYMATLHRTGGDHAVILVKGAPERVVGMCSRALGPDGPVPLDPEEWHARIEALAAQGRRVIAVAMRNTDAGTTTLSMSDVEGGLTLLALCGLIDPAREEAITAVAACRAAGIRVKMITGDHVVTARAIGASFGLAANGKAVTGPELDRIDDESLIAVADETDVFARTTPEHKLRLVRALQAKGHAVAMTGDGVNDAPALKRADVGVAMGRNGTEAAKEAAAMVLADDNFASIAHAVEEGRTVYDNLRKTILFMLPTNGAQAMVIVIAVLAGYTLPITPVQVLWVNMVSAVTLGLALAFEKPEPDVMRRPPRDPDEPILAGFVLVRMGLVMVLLVIASFGAFLYEEAAGASLERARTLAVNALVVGEIFFLLNARSVFGPVLTTAGLFGSRPVWIAIGLIVVLQLAFTYAPPMQALFGTAAIAAADWAALAAAGTVILLAVEAEKTVTRRIVLRTASR